MKPDHDLLSLLPRRLALRFESLGGYVSSVIHEQEELGSRRDRLTRHELRQIQIVVFTHVLHSMFKEGTRAASFAVDALKKLDVPGFRVGTTVFAGRNENVMRGESLARALADFLGDQNLTRQLDTTTSLRKRILELRQEVLRARIVDRPDGA